jgi:6,7-dimethyl-8-ribityllumazine synthase
MSGQGAPELTVKNCTDLRVGVVAAQWHEQVMTGLLEGALKALAEVGIEEPMVVRVPGSFELPVVARSLASRGYDAVVALGTVIRGGTPHFDYVCSEAARSVTLAQQATGVPIGFGVLTCENHQQAVDRSGGTEGNKGAEAAGAAADLAAMLQDVQ